VTSSPTHQQQIDLAEKFFWDRAGEIPRFSGRVWPRAVRIVRRRDSLDGQEAVRNAPQCGLPDCAIDG
jgi:hypothetical protein